MTLLLAAVVDVTIVLALTMVALAALRGRAAALRHAVLSAAIVAAVMSPVLEALVPQLPLVRWDDAARVTSSGLTLTSGEAIPLADVATEAPQSPPLSWSAVALGIWALGGVVVFAGLLTSLVRLARLSARCAPVLKGPWRKMADELSCPLGIRKPVTLLQSGDPSLLVTYGVLRPRIILPAGADTWSDDRRRSVLAHELAHVRRRDSAMLLAGELLRVVHWFNPLVWLSCRQLRQESEHACDDAVLREGVEAAEYATHLLGVAKHAAGRHQAWAAAAAIANPSTLERRISAVLNHRRNREPVTPRAWAGAALAAAAVIVPLAAAGVAPSADSRFVTTVAADDVTLPPASVVPAAPTAPTVAVPAKLTGRPDAAAAVPQTPGSVSGTMLDTTGGALPGVQLTLGSASLNLERTTVTDGTGKFVFRDLQPARYDLVARLPGFATASFTVPLATGAVINRAITMQVGTLAETVSVVGCSPGPVASALEPGRPGDSGRTVLASRAVRNWRFREALDRAFAAIVPVLSAQEPAQKPVRVGGNIKAPVKITDVKPGCPETSLPFTDATIRLVAQIGVDGAVGDARPIPTTPEAAPPPELVGSAIDAVRQWKFTPTLLNGEPTAVTMIVTVRYSKT
jgi:beta-lactamase regulating signal transducer with metallopeptidase domain